MSLIRFTIFSRGDSHRSVQRSCIFVRSRDFLKQRKRNRTSRCHRKGTSCTEILEGTTVDQLLLSLLSKVFDPIVLVAPFTVSARLLSKDVWRLHMVRYGLMYFSAKWLSVCPLGAQRYKTWTVDNSSELFFWFVWALGVTRLRWQSQKCSTQLHFCALSWLPQTTEKEQN